MRSAYEANKKKLHKKCEKKCFNSVKRKGIKLTTVKLKVQYKKKKTDKAKKNKSNSFESGNHVLAF